MSHICQILNLAVDITNCQFKEYFPNIKFRDFT